MFCFCFNWSAQRAKNKVTIGGESWERGLGVPGRVLGPREGWVAASCPVQGAGGVTAVGVLRTLKNGRRCTDGALGQESCYLGPALRLEAVRCCRRGRVSDFPQSRTTRVLTVTCSKVTSFGAENPELGSVRINGPPPVLFRCS